MAPDEIPILWAITPIMGETREVAEARNQDMIDLLPLEVGAVFLSEPPSASVKIRAPNGLRTD